MTDLTPADLEPIAQLCLTHHLEIRAARRQGVLLELVPASLDALPSAHQLSEIADALAGDGVRYVALSLDEELS